MTNREKSTQPNAKLNPDVIEKLKKEVAEEQLDPSVIERENEQVCEFEREEDEAHAGETPIIFLDDIKVTFKTRTGSLIHPNLVHAVQGLTLKLWPGETIGIVGESGCGKSTTANVMCEIGRAHV